MRSFKFLILNMSSISMILGISLAHFKKINQIICISLRPYSGVTGKKNEMPKPWSSSSSNIQSCLRHHKTSMSVLDVVNLESIIIGPFRLGRILKINSGQEFLYSFFENFHSYRFFYVESDSNWLHCEKCSDFRLSSRFQDGRQQSEGSELLPSE